MEPTGSGSEAPRVPRGLSQRDHRRAIGYLGLSLPLLVYLVAGYRHTDGLDDWHLLTSVSAYYYTGAVGIFSGVLFALSLFLLTYGGYEGVVADRIVGRFGGTAALGVALFPTTAPGKVIALPWWNPHVRTAHYVSAVVLFSSFALFSLWLFRKTSAPTSDARTAEKKCRDAIYLGCGIAILAGMLWAGSSLITHAPIFWPETLAIVAFAASWLAKGEADYPIRQVIKRFLNVSGER